VRCYTTVINIIQGTHVTHITYVTHCSNIVTCGMLMAACLLLSWCLATSWSSQVRWYTTVHNIPQVTHVMHSINFWFVDGCMPAELVPNDTVDITSQVLHNCHY
jgi:hypothetical protein